MYGRRPQQGSYDDGGGGNAVYMNVASSIVGAIIGRGGSRIRELEETSGARIKIYNSDNDDGGERRIEITGSPHSQDSAKNLIEQVIDGTYQDEYGGGGGRYGGGGGGRYGGGGGGGGGGGNCFKCGEPGHFARDCSSGGGGGGMRGGGRSFGRGGGGGGGGGNCYKCGEPGHFARECNSSDNYGGSRGGSRW